MAVTKMPCFAGNRLIGYDLDSEQELIDSLTECARHFINYEDAELFCVQALLGGNIILSVNNEHSGWLVQYYEVTPKREIKTMTVSELISKADIGKFKLTFKNVLNQIIENPNPNIIGSMKVKATEIDWLAQTATIMVVSL